MTNLNQPTIRKKHTSEYVRKQVLDTEPHSEPAEQSASTAQALPGKHRAHALVPPQSVSASAKSSMPFEQVLQSADASKHACTCCN
jgi:hypothetical protein